MGGLPEPRKIELCLVGFEYRSRYPSSILPAFSSEKEVKNTRDTLREKILQVNGLLPFPKTAIYKLSAVVGSDPQFFLRCYRAVENQKGCGDCTYNPDIYNSEEVPSYIRKLSKEEILGLASIALELGEQFKQ